MNDDLNQIADRANSSPYKSAGLISCGVESENPPVLRYTFDSDLSAHGFANTQLASGSKFLYQIYPARPNIVFEDRAPSEWQRLMYEQDAARDAYLTAFGAVNQHLVAVARGGRRNPTMAEVQASLRAWDRWQDVIRRMHEYAEKHAGS